MHTDKNEYFDFIEDENPVQLKQMSSKYLRYWPWFCTYQYNISF